jgi:hypothetical protein
MEKNLKKIFKNSVWWLASLRRVVKRVLADKNAKKVLFSRV